MVEYCRIENNEMIMEGITVVYSDEGFKEMGAEFISDYFEKIYKLKNFNIKRQNYEEAALFRRIELQIKNLLTQVQYNNLLNNRPEGAN